MYNFLKWVAIGLTILIVVLIYPAIIYGLFATSLFWVTYLILVLLDWLILRFLKKKHR